MSKLQKFLAQPGLFIQDAIDNARVRSALRGRREPPDTESDLEERVPLAHVIARSLAGVAEVFTSPDPDGRDPLNCFVRDVPLVLHHALAIAERRSCQLLVGVGRKLSDVDKRNVVATARALFHVTDFELRFASRGPDEVVAVMIWERSDGVCRPRGNNAYTDELSVDTFESLWDRERQRLDLSRLYPQPIDSECRFDVDIVYTWVNHDDPEWRALIARFRNLDEVDWERYRDNDELRYSMRSIDRFAPWVRTIFVVTNCGRPAWLAEHPRVRWVPHEAVFPASEHYLPTFNSHAIESCLMRIDGLSEHFVYMNDDVFMGMPIAKSDLFAPNGMSLSHLERYGVAFGAVDSHNPDYLNAAINGRRLIEETFGVSPTQLHAHTAHALRRSVLFEMEARYPERFDAVRRARFRSSDDLSVVSFLYHHYAFQRRRALRVPAVNAHLVRPANSAESYVEMLAGKPRPFFCINDGGSSTDDGFFARTAEFLSTYYPTRAPWEA